MTIRSALCLALAAALLSCADEPPPRKPPARAPPSEADLLAARVRQDPGDAEAWFHLSEIFERARRHEEEAEALRKVVALRPEMGWAHLRLGTACNRLGRYDEAVRHFLDAERTMKGQATLYNNLAWSYGRLGRTADEIAALRKAIALRPGYAVARYNLGVALLRAGARAEAEAQARALRALDEGAAEALEQQLAAPAAGGKRS